MGKPIQDPVYGQAEVMSPQELQALGLAQKPTGPLAPTATPSRWPTMPWQKPSGSGVFSSPRGFMGPGLLAHLDAKLYGRTPAQSESHINQTLRMAGPLAASGGLGPVAAAIGLPARFAAGLASPGFLASIPLQGALQAGATAATKGSTNDIIGSGILGAGLQGIIGGIFKAAELAINKKAAATIIARESARAREALTSYEQKKAFDTAMGEALDQMGLASWKARIEAMKQDFLQQRAAQAKDYAARVAAQTKDYVTRVAAQDTQHAAAVQAHGDASAARIMDAWKDKVPAWEGLSSNLRGLVDAVVGKGQDLASAAFASSLKQIETTAAGKMIELPRAVATQLGLEIPPVAGGNLTPGIRAALEAAGRLPPGSANAENVLVDAAKVVAATVGKGKQFPDAYHVALDTLAKAGFGTEEARAAYSAAQGLRQVIDKTGAINTRGSLDVNALLDGLQKIKNSDIIRTRGLGNTLEGDLAKATEGAPVALAAIPKPEPIPKPDTLIPPMEPAKPLPTFVPSEPKPGGPLSPKDLGIEYASDTQKAGLGSLLGHTAGYAIGAGLGHPLFGLGIGGGAGAALGRYLPTLVTKTPMTGGISDALRSAAMASGALAPGAIMPGSAEAGPLNPMTITPPNTEAEARAAQAAIDAETEARRKEFR